MRRRIGGMIPSTNTTVEADFGLAAGIAGRGYYSYEVGAWHVIALNSNCSIVSCSQPNARAWWESSD